MIKILNQSLQLQAIVTNVLSPLISEEINREFSFTFKTVIDGEKSQYINYQHIAEVEGNYFDIAYTKESRNADDTLTIDVECDHVAYRLSEEDNILESFIAVGTCQQLLNTLLNGTIFTVGAVEFTDIKTIAINEKTTRRAVLLAIASAYGGELKFDKFQISLLLRRGADRGVQFRYRKNNISVTRSIDNRTKINGLPKVNYEVKVAELEFADGYDSDEHFELGDSIDVIDGGLNLDISARIVKHDYNPFERMQGDVTIANFTEDISDTITRLQQTTVVKGNIYNGCSISPENGFEAIRSDNQVRTIMNATSGIAIQKGDGSGNNWQNMFYVDSQGNQHMSNTYIELVSELATILLDPSIGIKISNSSGDVLYIDPVTGKLKLKDIAIEITTSDGKTKIIIDAANGSKIQKNTGTAWEDVSYQDTEGNMILKGNVIAGKFFGATKDSAYIEIGNAGGQSSYGDLKLFRGTNGGSYPIFSIFDDLSIVDIKAGSGSSNPVTFLSSNGSNSYTKGAWNCSNAQFTYLNDGNSYYAKENWVTTQINNAIAAHVAAYHT